jgi:hypothetical protein
MVPSELTRRVGMEEILVLLVCWKFGPYGVPDQQGHTVIASYSLFEAIVVVAIASVQLAA